MHVSIPKEAEVGLKCDQDQIFQANMLFRNCPYQSLCSNDSPSLLVVPIQAVYPYEDPVALICNEDGKFMGLPLNRALRDDTGEIYDIIAGNFLITGLGEESFSDLSPDLMEKYKEQFLAPESFVRIGGKILAVKQPVPGAENKDMTQKPPHKSGPEL